MCSHGGICFFWPQNAFLPRRNVEDADITRSWKTLSRIVYDVGAKVILRFFGPKPNLPQNRKDAKHGEGQTFNFLLRMILIPAVVQNGQYSRAIQALTSRGLDQKSQAAMDAREEKHPHAPPPQMMPDDLPPSPRFDAKEVRQAVFSFKPGSAPGPSGLRLEHLKKMITTSDPAHGRKFLNALTSFTNLLFTAGFLDRVSPFICSANLFAAKKKDGGHRPVAVGETLRRLVSKCAAFKFTPLVVDTLVPSQLGVGVRGGVEIALHSVRAILDDPAIDQDDKWVLQIDFKNAFNQISREAIFKEVREVIPQLSSWVEKAYGSQPFLHFGSALLLSHTGVHQGDPLASLLFALGTRQIQRQIKERVPDVKMQVWIHDDGTVVGSLPALRETYDLVAREGNKIGLELAPSKSLIWNSEPVVDQDPLQRGVPRGSPEGFELLGAPIGNAAFSNAVLTKQIAKIEEALRKLPELQDSHVEFTLLRSCLGLPKFGYCLRTCNPRDVAPSYMAFDGVLRDSLNTLLGVQVDEIHWMQASLPVSMGGLGLRNARPHAPGAYLVSLLHAAPTIKKLLPTTSSGPLHRTISYTSNCNWVIT